MRCRWKESMRHCKPLEDYDILITGLRSEKGCLRKIFREQRLDLEKINYIPSHDTWTNIVNTQHFWEKYDEVFITSSALHIRRIEKVFSLLDSGRNITYSISDEEDVAYAGFSLWMYSSLLGCKIMSYLSGLVRRVWRSRFRDLFSNLHHQY